jgi:phosphohistidine phosphatase
MDSDADRTLLVLRHGHADRPAGIGDFDRPLSDLGRKQIRAIAEYMDNAGHRPELILCSSSKRTRDTAQTFIEHIGLDVGIIQTRALYLAYVDEIVDAVASVPDSVRSLMVVGHNPGFSDLVERLAGQHVKFKTGTLAVFKFCPDMQWNEIFAADPQFLGAFSLGKH